MRAATRWFHRAFGVPGAFERRGHAGSATTGMARDGSVSSVKVVRRGRALGVSGWTAAEIFFVVAASYTVGSEMAWGLFGAQIGLAFFPPAGITLAAFIAFPTRRWPFIVGAIVFAENAVNLTHHAPLGYSLSYTAANLVEPLVGALVVLALCRRAGVALDLRRRPDMFRFIVGALIIGPLCGGIIGATVQTLQRSTGWPTNLLHWWAGDALGVLSLGAPILAFRRGVLTRVRVHAEVTAIVLVALTVSFLAFWVWEQPVVYVVLPVLLWAAFRINVSGVGLASLVIAIVANFGTAHGHGPFAALSDVSPAARLGLTQLFLAVTFLTAWFFAIEIEMRATAERNQVKEREDRIRAEGLVAAESLSNRLSALQSPEHIASEVIDYVRAMFNATSAAVSEIEAPSSNEPFASHATARTGESWWLESPSDAPDRFAKVGPLFPRTKIGAVAAIPLGPRLGKPTSLIVVWDRARQYTPDDRTRLTALATLAGEALERTRAYEEVRSARDEAQQTALQLAKLQAVTAGLAAAVTSREIASIVAHGAGEAIGASAGSVFVVDLDTAALRLIGSTGYDGDRNTLIFSFPTAPTTLAGKTLQLGRAVLIDSPEELEARFPGTRMLQHGHQSWAVFLLRVAERDIGVLLFAFSERRRFTEAERAFMEAIADQCAQSVDRARQHEEEHEAVVRMQRSLLPLTIHSTDNAVVSACYRPAAQAIEVGGDWYDAIRLPHHQVMFIVGDVVGRGVPAALAMGQLRSAARALGTSFGPARLLEALDAVVSDVEGAAFTTMACVMLDALEGELRYSIAGHPPPLWRGADGRVRQLTGGRSRPLGPMDTSRSEATESIGDGGVLMLYTDGLIERRRELIDVGLERASSELERADTEDTSWCEAVIDGCREGAGEQRDDIAVLGVAVRPYVARLHHELGSAPNALGASRAAVRAWLHDLAVTRTDVDDVLIAVGEACSNAVMHAGSSAPSPATIDMEHLPGRQLHMLITDHGRWHPRSAGEPSAGGRGIAIMRKMMEAVDITTSDQGTTVRMRRQLAPRASN